MINEYRFRKCRETHLVRGSRIFNIFLLKLKTVIYVLRVVIEHVDSQALRSVNNKIMLVYPFNAIAKYAFGRRRRKQAG